jgi:fatty-acyl-CoA synthase
VGELLLRGPHVCAGYWRRPEETAKALAGGWLHTGDLAERDADGCYRIVGRVKDLIISGGENIYPAEVEGVLAGHPAVAEVAVIGVPDPKWGEVPRALVVSRPGVELTAEALLSYCQGRLARYKTPKTVLFVEALPRTAAGKVDRRALAARHGTA